MELPANIDELRTAAQAGERFKYLYFWGHVPTEEATGPWCLSQWWEAPFVIDGLVYATAEHYMMAEKARIFGDERASARARAARSPGEAKRVGREVEGFDEALWTRERFGVVVRGSTAKFSQHDDLKTYLLGTKNRVLVEASPKDRIWGIGLAENEDSASNPLNWDGLNLLGFALMKVRNSLG